MSGSSGGGTSSSSGSGTSSSSGAGTSSSSTGRVSLLGRLDPEQRAALAAVEAKRARMGSPARLQLQKQQQQKQQQQASSFQRVDDSRSTASGSRAASAEAASNGFTASPTPVAASVASPDGGGAERHSMERDAEFGLPLPRQFLASAAATAALPAPSSQLGGPTSPPSSDGGSNDDGGGSVPLHAVSSTNIPAPLRPHEGSPARAFLALFIATHAYVQRVPLRRLWEYEEGLYRRVGMLPAPGLWRRGGNDAVDSLSAPLSPSSTGFYAPYTSETLLSVTPAADADATNEGQGTPAPSLLDAALSACVPAAVSQRGLRIDIAEGLRAATLRLAGLAAPPTDEEEEGEEGAGKGAAASRSTAAEEEQARLAAAAATAAARVAPIVRRSYLSVLMGGVSTPPSSGPPPPSPTQSPSTSTPAAAAGGALGGGAGSSSSRRGRVALSGHIRLEPGTVWGELPLEWRCLHVAVAEYTRRFCDEPEM